MEYILKFQMHLREHVWLETELQMPLRLCQIDAPLAVRWEDKHNELLAERESSRVNWGF